MELDGRRIPDATTLQADVCIVGAGPAGLVLAREFTGGSSDVVILESGGFEPDTALQQLNEGTIVGDPYLGLRQTRHRQVGGTAHTWNTPVGGEMGAKYVPLDPWDFEARGDGGLSGWPFAFSHLGPFYRRAQEVCGLGPFQYDDNSWSDKDKPRFAMDGANLTTRVYQFGSSRPFTEVFGREVMASPNVRLCHHTTVTRLETGSTGDRVMRVSAVGHSGTALRVEASFVVLAAGAIENARVLLLLAESGSSRLSNRGGWIGRCFMEHPRDYALTLFPKSRDFFREAAFYDAHAAQDGTIICGRLALTEQAVRAGFPNASITLLPRTKVRRPPGGIAGRLVHRVHALGERLPGGVTGRLLHRLHSLVRGPPGGGYGWSHTAEPSRRFDAFQVLMNVEQQPNPANRIALGTGRDAHGLPRVTLHWRWRDEEQAELARLRTAVAAWLEAADLGRVEIQTGARPDPNAHHHAGTTRMHADPSRGVVDADGRVHAMDNLYVTGASLFPTAGFANPVLTIVALALRLGDHLKARV